MLNGVNPDTFFVILDDSAGCVNVFINPSNAVDRSDSCLEMLHASKWNHCCLKAFHT